MPASGILSGEAGALGTKAHIITIPPTIKSQPGPDRAAKPPDSRALVVPPLLRPHRDAYLIVLSSHSTEIALRHIEDGKE